MRRKPPELHDGDEALDRFTKALKSIFSLPRKDAERIRREAQTPMARKSDLSVPDTATAFPVVSKNTNELKTGGASGITSICRRVPYGTCLAASG